MMIMPIVLIFMASIVSAFLLISTALTINYYSA